MPRKKTSIYIDEELLRAAKVQAARHGKKEYELFEEALRNYLGLGLLERVWARSDLDEEAAGKLAYEELEAARADREKEP